MTTPPPPFVAPLRDGTRVRLRPIEADDKAELQQGLSVLSLRSRYLRFHTPVHELTPAQLRYLTEVDYHDHMAWVAFSLDEPGEPGIGVARYIRIGDEPSVAEAAVTVLDAYQGRGLGTLLLTTLARSAVTAGIRTFRNYVLAENVAMLEVFDQFGEVVRVDEGDGVYRIDVPLPADPDELPGTPAPGILRAGARGLLPPGLITFLRTVRERAWRSVDEPQPDETAAP